MNSTVRFDVKKLWAVVLLAVIVAAIISIEIWDTNEVGIQFSTPEGATLTNAYVFEQAHIALVTKIERREDGLVNWDRYVICPNSQISAWTSASGYSYEEFVQIFHVTQAEFRARTNEIAYSTNANDGKAFIRSSGCPVE